MAKDAKKTQSKTNNKKSVKEENKKVVKTTDTKKKEAVVKEEKVKEEPKVEIKEVKKVKEVKEKTLKDKEVKKKDRDEKIDAAFAKIDDNRKGIILFVIGFLIATLLFRCILWPDRIATLKDGTQPIANIGDKVITADDLYTDMKQYYSVKVFLNKIDTMILEEKYPENDEMKKSVQSTADYYYSVYEKNYQYTKEKFLSEYGFANEEEFLESLTLDYRRNKYFEDYVLGLVTDKEIEKYYNDEVFGDIDSKHILVSVKKDSDKDGLSDEEAKKLANEIIEKLNNGTSWDDVVSEYKDQITSEDLGYQAFNASLESAYVEEMRNLEVNSYSKSPVLTSYGYHIVYKKAQKDKPELKDVKDDIKEEIATEKKNNDSNLYYKALISMREDAKLTFVDTKLGDEYKEEVNKYK